MMASAFRPASWPGSRLSTAPIRQAGPGANDSVQSMSKSICRPDGSRPTAIRSRRTAPSGVRPTGRERSRRPFSTRSGCCRENPSVLLLPSGRAAAIEKAVLKASPLPSVSSNPPSASGRARPSSAAMSKRQPPASKSASARTKSRLEERSPNAPSARAPRNVSVPSSRPAPRPTDSPAGRQANARPCASASTVCAPAPRPVEAKADRTVSPSRASAEAGRAARSA